MFQILVKIVIANKFSFIVDVHYKDALSKASKEVEKLMTETKSQDQKNTVLIHI